jgi:hypothetical protein
MAHEELPLFVHWEKTLGDLLDRTMKFPKAVRFTFSGRIDGLALDVLEHLAEARYAAPPRKRDLLREIDGALARIRVLLRLATERRYLDRGGFEHVVRNLDEAGRMVGGWRRELAAR